MLVFRKKTASRQTVLWVVVRVKQRLVTPSSLSGDPRFELIAASDRQVMAVVLYNRANSASVEG